MKGIFIELPAFERHRDGYFDDDSLSQLQEVLMNHPGPGRRFDASASLNIAGASERGAASEERGMTKKRDLFEELNEGFDALADYRAGKRTLRTHAVKAKPAPKITARALARIRRDMNLSRGVFASYLRTNVRTLENWEQGRATPNAQATLLILLVQRYPDTMSRLAEI